MIPSHGWKDTSEQRKREILDAIRAGTATAGPVHVELDLTDRCNVACYFCNQQDVRTTRQLPLEKVVALLDELVAGGLRSVRLSGGGDPLAYRGVERVLDELAAREIVVDNLTTNGALLSAAVAERLVVPGRCREVLVSLNTSEAEDYRRMMRVKPETFDRVIENVERLVALRGERGQPALSIQFLLDTANYERLPEMYALGRRLAADRIAVNTVLPIPNDRIAEERMLGPDEFARVAPFFEQVLAADRRAGRLFVCFSYPQWNYEIDRIRERLESPLPVLYPTAPSFREENGSCFFGWYSAAVRGTGELYPCCMLLHPDYRPLGNVLEGGSGFGTHWRGETFDRLRREMRDLLLAGGRILWSKKRFRTLGRACAEPGACGMKNMYFRGDEEFYRELGTILDERRRAEVGWRGGWRGLHRWWEIQRFRVHHGVRVRLRPFLRPFAAWLARRAPRLASTARRLERF
jgi:MoaA/NifB/PqqE/SkfB family radical SAM enzyme